MAPASASAALSRSPSRRRCCTFSAGRKALRLGQPVAAHRGGRDHQRRALGAARQQHGQRLQGLAQAHVVGQTGAEAGLRPGAWPRHSRLPDRGAVRLAAPWSSTGCRSRAACRRSMLWRKSWSMDRHRAFEHVVQPSAARRGMRVPCLSASTTAARSVSLARSVSVSAA